MPSRPSWLPSKRQGEAVFPGFLPTPSNPQAHSGISFRISSGLQLLISCKIYFGDLIRIHRIEKSHQKSMTGGTNSCSWCRKFKDQTFASWTIFIAWRRVEKKTILESNKLLACVTKNCGLSWFITFFFIIKIKSNNVKKNPMYTSLCIHYISLYIGGAAHSISFQLPHGWQSHNDHWNNSVVASFLESVATDRPKLGFKHSNSNFARLYFIKDTL